MSLVLVLRVLLVLLVLLASLLVKCWMRRAKPCSADLIPHIVQQSILNVCLQLRSCGYDVL
jgi:hypothetical protein